MFSRACEYGIKASIFIASQSLEGKRVSLKEIAEEIDSPIAFTAKILQQLSRRGILDSVKGSAGGFEIQKNQIDRIKLSDIVYAIDGNAILMECGLGLKKCNADMPCPVHHKFVIIRDELKNMLESTTLYEMTAGLEVGLTYLRH